MPDSKVTEVMKIMLEIMEISKDIAAKNRETVECVNKIMTVLSK